VAAFTAHRDDLALVLTDVGMPVMDGMATARALRRIDPAVKLIVTSGLGANAPDAEDPALREVVFLQKPFTAEALLRLLRRVLADRAG
jgi:CheY-like chemotaxis protein